MIIKGITKLTLIDFPGRIACTLFTYGCNFRCPFCQNPELITDERLRALPLDFIRNFLDERKGFLDGVCICGGEPTIHADLPEFCKELKKMGYAVKIDTNGSNPDILEELAKIVDYIAMDIKAPLDKYKEVTRANIDTWRIEESIEIVKSMKEYEFRFVAVPGLIQEKEVEGICKAIEGAEKLVINQFNNKKTLDKSFEKIDPYPPEVLEKFAEVARKYVKNVKIRGI